MQIVLLAGIFVLNFFADTDPDLWWHLAAGRYIVESGQVPHVDPFSYTVGGQPWIAHEWLSEVAIYLLYRSGGYLAAAVFFAILVGATFWIALRTLRALGMSAAAATSVVFWAALMSRPGWNVRPQTFSYLLFALYLYLLLRSRRRADGAVWLIPPLMAVWTNLHAGYVMGLLLLGFFIIGEMVNRRQVWRLVLLGATTLLATALNPHGLSVLAYPFTYAGTQNASMRYVAEWQSPNFHDYYFFIFGASMLLLMVAPRRHALDWALGAPLVVLAAMSLQSVRVIPFYALVFAAFMASRFGDPSTGTGGWETSVVDEDLAGPHGRPPQHPQSPISNPRPAAWNWLLLAVCLAVMASTLFLSDRTQWGPEPGTAGYPAAGVRHIREAGLTGNLFNSYGWGGFLIWSFYPERRVFVDGRADVYGDRFIEEYRKVHEVRPGWREVLDRYGIEVVLVESDGPTATLLGSLPEEWREVFAGEIEVVFVRSKPAGRSRYPEGATR